jgi:hypothetical protein
MAKGTEVAAAKTGAVVIMMDEFFEAYANEGLENISAQDLSIPYLRILAQLSPQVNKRDGAYVEGAEAGMIYNTVENTAYNGDAGLEIVPCYYRRVYVEWKPREKGGGFVATHSVDDPIVGTTYRDDRGQEILPNGNLLTNTAEFYVLMIGKDGPSRCLITMTSTQLKKARKWLTQMQTLTGRTAAGNIYTLPMMSHTYRLKTVQEKNDKGAWFGWDISKTATLDMKNSMEKELFHMALEFSKSVKAGEVKVKIEVDATSAAPQVASRHDDDIPF